MPVFRRRREVQPPPRGPEPELPEEEPALIAASPETEVAAEFTENAPPSPVEPEIEPEVEEEAFPDETPAEAIAEAQPSPSEVQVNSSAADPFELALFYHQGGDYVKALGYYNRVAGSEPYG